MLKYKSTTRIGFTHRHKGFFVAIFFSVLLMSCTPSTQKQVIEGNTMGTYYRITVVTDKKWDAKKVQENIDDELLSINNAMSTYIPDSEISLFNRSDSTEWQDISEPFYHVLLESLATSIETNGAFDITVGPLVDRWGFGGAKQTDLSMPTEDEIAEIMNYVGYQNIEASPSSPQIRKTNPLTQIDMSAIAKGFAVDRIVRLLQRMGYSRFLVDIGGEMSAYGDNIKNKKWLIGIEKPVNEQKEAIQLIELRDKSIATSGDYRNFIEKNGVKYSHTISPTTGASVHHKLASASVVTNDAMRADALATALMVMGEKAAFEFAEKKQLAVLLVVREQNDFKILISPEMEQYLVK